MSIVRRSITVSSGPANSPYRSAALLHCVLELAITQIERTLEVLTAVTPESHLSRETLVHQSPEVVEGCCCASCGGKVRKLGEDVSEVLELVPGFFKVIRHVREKHTSPRNRYRSTLLRAH